MNIWLAIGTVAMFGAAEFWLAVPAGFAFGLNPAVTCMTTIAGGVMACSSSLFPGNG
jgi:hypothetical protein